MSTTLAPTSTHLVEVSLRSEYSDAEGAGSMSLLMAQGLPSLKSVRQARLYQIKGRLSATQVQLVAKELLCDPVTQEFRVVSPTAPAMNGMNAWRIEVWPKPSVTDPVGDTVCEAIAGMGLPRPEFVRCAVVHRVLGRANKAALERAVYRTLANPLIHVCMIAEAHS